MRCAGWRTDCASGGGRQRADKPPEAGSCPRRTLLNMRLLPIAVLLASILLSACSASAPSAPAAAQRFELRMYTRNLTAQDIGLRLASSGSSGWQRFSASSECTAIIPPWTISIGPAGPKGATGPYTEIVTSANFGEARSVELWIQVSERGGIPTGAPWQRGHLFASVERRAAGGPGLHLDCEEIAALLD
jgi:hypothetical protein